MMPSSVALLRGINVGGKNLIRMPDQDPHNPPHEHAVFRQMTVRSWRTTTRLFEMLDGG